jgi:hypothetical protein
MFREYYWRISISIVSATLFSLRCGQSTFSRVEHEFMSRFYGTVWDSSGVGLLSWEDFLFGWTMLMFGPAHLSQQCMQN